MKENLRLRQEPEETRKETAFLKNGGILCGGNRLEAYRFIDENRERTRWLLGRLKIYPNAYYNYRKDWKKSYNARQREVKEPIEGIYHEHMGDGYRRMAVYLARKGFQYSFTTIHKYMNKELGLRSIV